MAVTIQVRRDSSANWASKNPVLASGEIGYETTSGKFKIGDGVSNWSSLSYFSTGQDVTFDISQINNWPTGVSLTEIGYLDGVTSSIQDQLDNVAYTLPVASASTLGGVKDGTGISIDTNGVLSIDYGTSANTAVQGNDVRVTADQVVTIASIRTIGTGALQAAAGNHNHSIDNLNNVQITDNTDDEILAWDASSSKWTNQTAAEAGLATDDHTHSTISNGTGINSLSYNGSASATISLSNTGVVANTYGSSTQVASFTVDEQGRLTSANNITIQAGTTAVAGIVRLYDGVDSNLSSLAATANTVNYIHNIISNDVIHVNDIGQPDGVASLDESGKVPLAQLPGSTLAAYGIADAYTKTEVDGLVTGLDFKQSVRLATAAGENIDLSTGGLIQVDGVSVFAGDRVLVKNQTDASQNGIYVTGNSSWVRASDADNSPAGEVTTGMYVFVSEGNTNADSGWVLSTNDTIILGTTNLTFTQFNGLGQITAGTGLTKTGNTLNVGGTSGRIAVNADSIDLDTVTQSTGSNFVKIDIDNYGRVTGNSAIAKSDITNLGIAADDQIMYIGTTATAINRSTGNLNLTGVSIDGSAGTVSGTAAANNTATLVAGYMGANDQFRIQVGGGSDSGYVEIATSDNGNEPIYVRQYNGPGDFANLVRTATLLDENGNTSFPGTVTADKVTHNGMVLSAASDGAISIDQSYTFTTSSLSLADVWMDTGIIGSSQLNTGVYMLYIQAGANEFYTATLPWYSGNGNSTVNDEYTEVVLQSSGDGQVGYPNNLYCRVLRAASNAPKLQISTDTGGSRAAQTYTLNFRRLW